MIDASREAASGVRPASLASRSQEAAIGECSTFIILSTGKGADRQRHALGHYCLTSSGQARVSGASVDKGEVIPRQNRGQRLKRRGGSPPH